MEDSIKTTRIDVNKIEKIFDEIVDFIMDDGALKTQDDCMDRVKVAELVFELAKEILGKMFDITCNYRRETSMEEFIEQITLYKDAINNLHTAKQMIDILQG